jgi:hypothetical protein
MQIELNTENSNNKIDFSFIQDFHKRINEKTTC